MGAEEVPSVPFSSNAMDNADYTDTELVHAVRKALASVQNVSVAHMLLLPSTLCIYICVCYCFVVAVFFKSVFFYQIQGDTDDYSQLKTVMCHKDYSDFDAVANYDFDAVAQLEVCPFPPSYDNQLLF